MCKAGYSVGVEKPTHFSEDYNKRFGVPPCRDRIGAHPVSADLIRIIG